MSEESSVPDDESQSPEEADALPSPAGTDERARQKSSAAVQKIDPAAVCAKSSGPITLATAEIIKDIQSYYLVQEGVQAY